ncbi:thioredoxin-like protein [Neohortaea acidophila]|uniref:Thioredoxin-like protein n=1 Tax=Neohortaea acidophila TaxID=245834 RepID=A0A6A6PXE1_9PEZI|nr:thioredoxin-like protein [Neohortaea acidophila]KAF2483907.1 thioredoxin-like protein [Neohortaea acidophila]
MEDIPDRKAYVKATNADGVAVLEGTATWCTQCKAIAPFVDKLIKKYPDARFYKYDTDHAPDIAHELGVNAMPTFHVFKDGDVHTTITGAKAGPLEKAIQEAYGDGKVEDVNTSE